MYRFTDFYENHVARPHLSDIFREGKMVVTCTISGKGAKWWCRVVVPNNQTCFWNFRMAKLLGCSLPPGCGPATLPILWHWFTLLAVPAYNLSSKLPTQTHNCTISLQERHLPSPLRHTEKHQFYWNWATLSVQSSSLQPEKLNVDKRTH